MYEALGLKEFFDLDDFVKLMLRLLMNVGFAWIVIKGIHYRLYRNRDMAFTYLLFNVITFSLCFLLRKVPIELGFALGLFAVFGILRYRTEPIRTRDLTYLFIVIGLALLISVIKRFMFCQFKAQALPRFVYKISLVTRFPIVALI